MRLFFLQEHARKTTGPEPPPVVRVAVIGAGVMGAGIAQWLAAHRVRVLLRDVDAARVAAGLARIRKLFSERRVFTEQEARDGLDRISPVTTDVPFQNVDLVIEAAVENEEIKRDILKKLCPSLKPGAMIASNTSSISITRLAAATDRPARFMGMHFMNPVPLMQLVELIRGLATDDETFAAVRDLSEKLGKTIAMAEDFPAFIVNRILLPMINEAVYTLYEGVGSVEAIDTAMRLGANHRMGPLELADFIGLDTCLSVMQVLHEGLADSKYRPCPLLVKYVEAGWLGRKSGRGFYDYSGDKPTPTR
jgi:3-hydroxybutyryl-CoA dehydrogenase